MATDINMFGTGGEGLAGMFVGRDIANQQALQQAQEQSQLASAAHANALAEGTQISNAYEQSIAADKLADAKRKYASAAQEDQIKAMDRQGEQFGKLGVTLASMPAAARPAALQQMATKYGITEDNPMLQHLMSQDPNTLPQIMQDYSDKFYSQSNASRAEKQKRDAMAAQAAATSGDRLQAAQLAADSRRDVAEIMAAARRDAAQAAADARRDAAADRASNKTERPLSAEGELIARQKARLAAGEISQDQYDNAITAIVAGKSPIAGKNAIGAQVMAGQTPTTPIQNAAELGTTLNPPGKNAGPKAPPGAPPSVQAAVEKAGQKYEPNLYDYRVLPDGRVQRKAKQGSGVPQ